MPSKMRAWVINRTGSVLDDRRLLDLIECEVPEPKTNEILVKVSASGVCHTELDEIEGRTPPPEFPVIPGHQVVGTVVARGTSARKFTIGERAAVGWIGWACGKCEKCRGGMENLCEGYIATEGTWTAVRRVHGRGRELRLQGARSLTDEETAPLLCAEQWIQVAQALGHKGGGHLGFTGFGASAHLVLKLAKSLYRRTGSMSSQEAQERAFAKELGAEWTGDISDKPPARMKAVIYTTPVWKTVVCAMENLQPGGRLVINAIRKENTDKGGLMLLDYGKHLWQEKEIKSVANVTRKDIDEFLKLADKFGIKPQVELFHLEDAVTALKQIKQRQIRGAKVLTLS